MVARHYVCMFMMASSLSSLFGVIKDECTEHELADIMRIDHTVLSHVPYMQETGMFVPPNEGIDIRSSVSVDTDPVVIQPRESTSIRISTFQLEPSSPSPSAIARDKKKEQCQACLKGTGIAVGGLYAAYNALVILTGVGLIVTLPFIVAQKEVVRIVHGQLVKTTETDWSVAIPAGLGVGGIVGCHIGFLVMACVLLRVCAGI